VPWHRMPPSFGKDLEEGRDAERGKRRGYNHQLLLERGLKRRSLWVTTGSYNKL